METLEQPVKRRPILGVSGWVLFVCIFLPVVRVCGDPMAPIVFPPTYALYIGSLLLAIGAVSATLRVRRGVFAAFIALWTLTAVTLLAIGMSGGNPMIGGVLAIAGIVGTVFTVRATVRLRPGEMAMMVWQAVHAGLCAAWYGLLSIDGDRMWGVWPGLAASAVMLVGSIASIAQISSARRLAGPIPPARTL